jgi:hypothetical protein
LPGYECFAGVEDGRGQVVLAEAGQDCRRGLRVDTLGMLLTKRSMFISQKEDKNTNWLRILDQLIEQINIR